jgi:Skp family chaperone for outer membrane proteins
MMKKVLFSLLAVVGLLFAADKTQAQSQPPLKIGVFDIETMVRAMPGYRNVDSLMDIYQRDSLATEYDFYQSEYKRLDSTYKADSTANKAKTVLDMEKQQRNQVAMQIVYWQQIAENKAQQKNAILAQPLYEQVIKAYQKVLETKKYTLILKPGTLERGTTGVSNVFEDVAKELKIPLPQELGGGADDGDQKQQQSAPAKPSTGGAAKPATKPKG